MSRGNSGILWEHKHSGSGETKEERGQRTGEDDVGEQEQEQEAGRSMER